jgi:hypothetical protein
VNVASVAVMLKFDVVAEEEDEVKGEPCELSLIVTRVSVRCMNSCAFWLEIERT